MYCKKIPNSKGEHIPTGGTHFGGIIISYPLYQDIALSTTNKGMSERLPDRKKCFRKMPLNAF